MKKIVYQRQIPAESTTLPNGETIVTREAYLQEEKLSFTDSNKEIQIAEALKYSYNGEYTIEDDGVESTVEDQIASLKTQLSSTDYKIIKCSEAQLLGEELPYDISSLHTERQALRDKINELEQQLEANVEGGAI